MNRPDTTSTQVESNADTGVDLDPSAADAATSGHSHLSSSIRMEQWLSLLVFTATLLLLLLTVAVAVRLLSAIGHTLLLFSLGGLLAYALDPLVEKLRAGRAGRSARTRSVMIVFALLLVCGILAVELLSKELVRQVYLLSEDHAIYLQLQRRARTTLTPDEKARVEATYEARAERTLYNTDRWLEEHNIHVNLSDQFAHPRANVRTLGQTVAERAVKMLEEVSKSAVEGLIVLLIALYFLIYCEEMRRGVLHGLNPRLRPYAATWMDDVNRILGGFVRGQLILALTIGAMAAGLCLVLGLRLWLLIGLFVVVASLIPVVGPFIGAIPAAISAAITPGYGAMTPLARVFIVVICFAVINEIGSKILYPKLVGKALGLHEVLVLFILFAGFEVGGLTGVLFAAPLTALSAVTLAQLYRLWQGEPPRSLAATQQGGANEVRAQGAP